MLLQMCGMFEYASTFNQSLNSWDISSVVDNRFAFHGASSFDKNNALWFNFND